MLLDLLKIKKVFSILSGTSLTGISMYYGVFMPIGNNRSPMIIPGSAPALNWSKVNANHSRVNGDYFVDDTEGELRFPSMIPMLRYEDMQTNIKGIDFSPNIRESLIDSKPRIKKPAIARWLTASDHLGKHVFQTAIVDTGLVTNHSVMSENEIPNKITAFSELVNGMKKTDFIHDLVLSLAEESNSKQTVIRPNSIRISFDLQEPRDYYDQDLYLTNARRISNFSFSFVIFNPKTTTSTILNTIPIDPLSESEINVSIKDSEIRTFSTPVEMNGVRYRGANWNLMPTFGNEINVSLNQTFPIKKLGFMRPEKLTLMYGRSKFFGLLISEVIGKSGIGGAKALNTPTFEDYKRSVEPLMSGITADQIQADVENWMGAFAIQQLKILAEDIKKLMGFMKIKNLVGVGGKRTNFADSFVNNKIFRNNAYAKFLLDGNVQKSLNRLFEGEKELKSEEVLAFIDYFEKELEKLQNSIKITIGWDKKPELDNTFEDDIYPNVSMKLTREIEIDEDITINLKGKGTVEGREVEYDLSEKIEDLQNLLSPFRDVWKPLFGKINIFSALIPDAQKFMKWKKFEIKKGSKIKEIYEANRSPLKPAIDQNSGYESGNDLVVPGWKLLDVSITSDFSGLSDVLYQIYSSMEKEKSLSCWTIITCGQKVWQNWNKKPISQILSLLNDSLFDSFNPSPLKTFVNSLLNNPWKVNSDQMFVGYSGTIFNMNKSALEKMKNDSSNDSKKIYEGKYKMDNEDYKINLTAKTTRIEDVLNSLHFHYSTFFPKPRMMIREWEYGNSPEYKRFLNNEAKTSIGLSKNLDQLKEIIKSEYNHISKEKNGVFPSEKLVKWEKTKLSLTQIKLSEALRTVFSRSLYSLTTIPAASIAGIDLNTFMGELLTRDLFWATINFMMEDGVFHAYRWPMKGAMIKSNSTHSFRIDPYVDQEKIKNVSNEIKSKAKSFGLS